MATEKLSVLLDGLSGKAPIDADKLPLLDSANSFAFETATLAEVRAAVQTRTVTAVTATASPSSANSGTAYTNEGDSDGATITLPSAAAGLQFVIYVQTAQTLTVTAGSGDKIRIGSSETAAAGSITSNTVGSAVMLLAINATEWVAIASVGSWSV